MLHGVCSAVSVTEGCKLYFLVRNMLQKVPWQKYRYVAESTLVAVAVEVQNSSVSLNILINQHSFWAAQEMQRHHLKDKQNFMGEMFFQKLSMNNG